MRKIFMRGLIAVTPVAITIAVLVWLFSFLENLFSKPIKAIIGPEHYFKGLGVIAAIVIIFFIGIIINTWLIKKFYHLGEKILRRIPVVKTIYSSIQELLMFFHEDNRLKKSVVVSIELAGVRFIGLITRDEFSSLPKGLGEEGEISVYLPMSYQIGGYTITVPRSKVKVIDMTFEDSMRYILSASILGTKN